MRQAEADVSWGASLCVYGWGCSGAMDVVWWTSEHLISSTGKSVSLPPFHLPATNTVHMPPTHQPTPSS